MTILFIYICISILICPPFFGILFLMEDVDKWQTKYKIIYITCGICGVLINVVCGGIYLAGIMLYNLITMGELLP